MSSLTSISVANLWQLEAISASKMYVKKMFVANSLHLAVIVHMYYVQPVGPLWDQCGTVCKVVQD
jgi:hypothetical protein